MTEIWKDIKDFPNYQVSNLGRIRSLNHNFYDINNGKIMSKPKTRILKQTTNKKGYLTVGLMSNNKQKRFMTHRLVALTFIPNLEKKEQVNHKNGIKTDNRIENLEWCTNLENMRHSIKTGLRNTEKMRKAREDFKNIYKKMGCGRHTKITKQYDKKGNLIKKWNSVKEASNFYGYNYKYLSMAVCGVRKTAYGCIWTH